MRGLCADGHRVVANSLSKFVEDTPRPLDVHLCIYAVGQY
jgi:hypothetical protein